MRIVIALTRVRSANQAPGFHRAELLALSPTRKEDDPSLQRYLELALEEPYRTPHVQPTASGYRLPYT